MGWDGSGSYLRIHNFSADASAGIKILASRMDEEINDIASAIPIAWARNGQNVPTVDMPMGGKKFVNVGAPTSVSNFMRVREFIENVPIFMQDVESSADRISVSSQYFTSVSANQAPVDGTKIMVRVNSNKSSAVLYLDGHSANVEYQDGNRIGPALVSGGVYEFTYSSVDTAWKLPTPSDGRTAAELSAGVTPVSFQYEPGLFERYAAAGDDVTNDYAAIAAALLQAGQAGGSPARAGKRNVVYFIGANTLTIPNDATLDISGAGLRTTDEAALRFGEGSVLVGYNATIESSGASGTAVAKTTTATVGEWFIYGFPQIRPTTAGAAGSVGINFTGAYRGRFQVHCGDFETQGIAGGGDATDASRCYYNTIEFRSNNQDGGTTGLLLREGCNGTVVLNPEINGSDELTYYIDCDGVSGLTIIGGYLEGSNDIAATRGIRLTDCSNTLIAGPVVEIATSVAANFALEVAGAISGLTFSGVGFGGAWGNSAKLGTATGLSSGSFNFLCGAPTNMVEWIGATSFPSGGTAGEARVGRLFTTGKVAAAVAAAADTAYTFDNTGDGVGMEIDNNSATVTANRAVLVANRKGGPGCVLSAQNNGAAAGGLWFGAGSPETVVAASVGSIYMRTDGGAATSMYVKESGTGTTGWVAK